jgi:hypothetical protein
LPWTSKGEIETMALCPRTVADFYEEFMRRLRGLGLETRIWTMPVEIPEAIPFELDKEHASYDGVYVTRFWRILVANLIESQRAAVDRRLRITLLDNEAQPCASSLRSDAASASAFS